MKGRMPLIISGIAVVAMCGFVFFMSDRPADESGAMSLEIVYRIIDFVVPGFADLPEAEQLLQIKRVEHIVRKIAHFSEYAVFGALMLNLVSRIIRPADVFSPTLKQAGLAWALASAYAVTDELHQAFVPGRSCMVTDMLIDSSGVLVGVLLLVAVMALLRHRRRRSSNMAR